MRGIPRSHESSRSSRVNRLKVKKLNKNENKKSERLFVYLFRVNSAHTILNSIYNVCLFTQRLCLSVFSYLLCAFASCLFSAHTICESINSICNVCLSTHILFVCLSICSYLFCAFVCLFVFLSSLTYSVHLPLVSSVRTLPTLSANR